MRTFSPRRSSSMPIEAEVSPFPSELTTPPVTKMCRLITAPSAPQSPESRINLPQPCVLSGRVSYPRTRCVSITPGSIPRERSEIRWAVELDVCKLFDQNTLRRCPCPENEESSESRAVVLNPILNRSHCTGPDSLPNSQRFRFVAANVITTRTKLSVDWIGDACMPRVPFLWQLWLIPLAISLSQITRYALRESS